MCGIVGAVAERPIVEVLVKGLERLEYRGYDSAGIAVLHSSNGKIQRLRVKGKITALIAKLEKKSFDGFVGIAHTRWATHGKPTELNAHPHTSANKIAIVHNGIIENHDKLRQKLKKWGCEFKSETDTEVVVHLIHHYYKKEKNLLKAIQRSTRELVGAYALGIICTDEPGALYAIRSGSPLVIGCGKSENFIASDASALSSVTKKFIYLEEGDLAKITSKSVDIVDAKGKAVTRKAQTTQLDGDTVNKGKYQHFMLKEIFEQPKGVFDTINGHFINNRINTQSFGHRTRDILSKVKRIQMVACGTSYHAALVGRYWLEALAGIPCQVEIASENRYRKGVIEPNTLFIALSQSGETADTLAALRQAKKSGYMATLGICNVHSSSVAREADIVFLTRAGTEIGVAATKTFTTQLVALLMLAMLFQSKHAQASGEIIAKELKQLPVLLENTLSLDRAIQKVSKRFVDKKHALFLGRGALFPIALEGALKLKEISYMHAEAYPAGELKHGPLALVEKGMPVIVVAPNDHLIEKLESNMQEVQARGGELFVFMDETLQWRPQAENHLRIPMPRMPDIMAPIAYTIPLQLLAYHIAVLKGTDVDQPRNLAKSVTVE